MDVIEKYKNPGAATDIIIEKSGRILLVRRKEEPFKGKLQFPAGFVNYGETIEHAAKREVKEETGLNIRLLDILGVYSHPKRDPRGHVISTVFIAEIINGNPTVNDKKEIESVAFYDIKKLKKKELAFDNFRMIQDYLRYKKKKETFWSTK